jgi:uncharacterized protein YecE (DUF72 family)
MTIRVGIGGWTYTPWRGVFYPKGLRQADELQFASRAVTTIEVNGTFYGSQKPASFRKWRDEAPDDFVFALKGPRFAVNRRVLAEAGESVERFFASGVTELGDKLGPINWQLAATKKFDPDDIAAFLVLLPTSVEGVPVRHVIEARHESFRDPEFTALARKHGVAVVLADAENYPTIADVTADFVYARLQRAEESIPTGYSEAALTTWAKRAEIWAAGGEPEDLDPASDKKAAKKKRDVFIFMINGAKLRAPAAAMALIERLKK